MDAYLFHDARFITELVSVSAANALTVALGPVPIGKTWTVLSGRYTPSAAETQQVWWGLYSPSGVLYPVTQVVSIALSSVIPFSLVTEGMELKLFPKEYLTINRAVATAGSTMSVFARVIETDLPYYSYEDPQKKVVYQLRRHGSVYRSSGGISQSGGGGGTGPGSTQGGGGGGAEPY